MFYGVTISPEKIILRRKKELCAIFYPLTLYVGVRFTIRVGAKLGCLEVGLDK